MTDQIQKRGKDFEAKFAHDQDLDFKARARRNHFLALWAAGQLDVEDVDGFVETLISTGLHGDEAVAKQLRADFDAAGVDVSDHQIEREMADQLVKAREQVMSEV
ncbi:MAG: DUF1476 domain-containing protein [Alphaproteobacteria bacterium]